jgi:ABC-type nickel/cobalt efflux system permease component RcnA
MQSNTDSTAAERVEQPHNVPVAGYAGFISASAVAVLFVYWLWRDLQRERQWFAERKRRMAHFRQEARRRHEELAAIDLRERSISHAARIRAPEAPQPAAQAQIDDAPKKRKIFKLYG